MYKSFEEMPVWKEAIDLADKVYNLIEKFPKTELYALSDQLKRASVSVSANIAESFGRYHVLEKIKFYFNARGSLCETKSHLLFATKRNYISTSDYELLDNKINKIMVEINIIIKSIRCKYIKDKK